MDRVSKEKAVEQIGKAFTDAEAAFLIDYKGCNCSELTQLKNELRKTGATFSVVKNTLTKRAIAGSSAEGLNDFLVGPTALVWTGEDQVSPAKIVSKFSEEKEEFQIKAGVFEGEVVSEEVIKELATLPSKEELYGQLLRLMIAPATRLAQTMNEPATQLARLLEIRRTKLEEKGDS